MIARRMAPDTLQRLLQSYYRLGTSREDDYTTLERKGLKTHDQPTKVGGHKARPRKPALELRGCDSPGTILCAISLDERSLPRNLSTNQL